MIASDQPKRFVRPRYPGLVFCAGYESGAFGAQAMDRVFGRLPTTGNYNYAETITPKWVGRSFVAGSIGLGCSYPLNNSQTIGSSDFSILVVGKFNAGDTITAVACCYRDSSGGVQARMQPNYNGSSASANAFAFQTYDGAFLSVGANSVITGGPQVFVGRRLGSEHTIWVDGVKRNTATGTAKNLTGSGLVQFVGGLSDSTSFGINGGSLALVLQFNRALGDDEILSLSANPWQIYEDDSYLDIAVLAGAAAGTGSSAYSLDVTGGSIAVSGSSIGAEYGRILGVSGSAIAATGGTVGLYRGTQIAVTGGSIAVNGGTVAPELGRVIAVSGGTVSVSGGTVSLDYAQNNQINVTGGTVTVTGAEVTLTYTQLNSYSLLVTGGTIVVAGGDVTTTYAGASIWTPQSAASTTWANRSAASTTWTNA